MVVATIKLAQDLLVLLTLQQGITYHKATNELSKNNG